MTTPVESPCNAVCTLDASGRMCVGCMRTVEEIAQWGQLSDAQRAQVLSAIARRSEDLASRGWVRQVCGGCGAEFSCGAGAGAGAPCWCVRYPAVTPSGAGAKCLCPACLTEAASRE